MKAHNLSRPFEELIKLETEETYLIIWENLILKNYEFTEDAIILPYLTPKSAEFLAPDFKLLFKYSVRSETEGIDEFIFLKRLGLLVFLFKTFFLM